jgi:hypothetical protein
MSRDLAAILRLPRRFAEAPSVSEKRHPFHEGLLIRHALRALDVVQLASALALRARPLRFWCADGRLASAAQAEGLKVVRPG